MKLSSSSYLVLNLVFASAAPTLGMDLHADGYFSAELPEGETMTSAEQDYFAFCMLDSYNALPGGKATLETVAIKSVGPIDDIVVPSTEARGRKLYDWWPYNAAYNHPNYRVGSSLSFNGGCNYCNDYDDDDPFQPPYWGPGNMGEEEHAAFQREVIEDDEPKYMEWAGAICACLQNGPFEALQGAHDCMVYVPRTKANGFIDQENDVVRHGMFHGSFQSTDELSDTDKTALGQVIIDAYNQLHTPDTGFTMKSIEIGSGTHADDSKNDALPWYMSGSNWSYEMTTTAECLFCTSECNEDDDMVDCSKGKKKLSEEELPAQSHHVKLAELICTKLNQGSVPALQKVHDCILWYDDSVSSSSDQDVVDEEDGTTPSLLRGVAKALKIANN